MCLNLRSELHGPKDFDHCFTVEGKCYTFGSNQFGQLGYEKEPQDRRPALVKALNSCKLSAVACGDTFTMAVSEGIYIKFFLDLYIFCCCYSIMLHIISLYSVYMCTCVHVCMHVRVCMCVCASFA